METADQLARMIAKAIRDEAPGTLTGVNANPADRFARIIVRTPAGMEFTVQIEEN
jgi:hypothetical protein